MILKYLSDDELQSQTHLFGHIPREGKTPLLHMDSYRPANIFPLIPHICFPKNFLDEFGLPYLHNTNLNELANIASNMLILPLHYNLHLVLFYPRYF
ncbi:hypothetical protein IMSAG025_02257 [Muribaculaceae bacterium]|nr:hypothetical protein IMSAG025_02257 [Muribaculaceae bacterium]